MTDQIFDVKAQIDLPMDKIVSFCHKWKITELALFGSVLRDDFRPDSDVDVLVSYASNSQWSLLDAVDRQEELEAILGRKVDLVSRHAIETSRNYIRRKAILNSAQVIYVA